MARVLIVDDNQVISALYKKIFSRHQHDVLICDDGLIGLNTAREWLPDLLVLDVNLPRLNGFEVCQLLKAHEDHKVVKILMLSGKSDEAAFELSRKVGANGYMTKDSSPADVLKAAEELMQQESI